MARNLPRYVTERIGAPPWNNCVLASGLMAANKGSHNAHHAIAIEVLRLRAASGIGNHAGPGQDGAEGLGDLARALHGLYGYTVDAIHGPSSAAALAARLNRPDWPGAVVIVEPAKLVPHFRRWDPAFPGLHAVYVQATGTRRETDGGALWYVDPMIRRTGDDAGYRGEWIHVADLAPAYRQAIIVPEDGFVKKGATP
jgi:hypothetical protein